MPRPPGRVFKSTDAGQSWKPVGHELERTVVRCIATDTAPKSPCRRHRRRRLRSADRGKTWQRREATSPAIVYALALIPAIRRVFITGTAAGVFETLMGRLEAHARIGRGRAVIPRLDASRGRLYAGTLGRGVCWSWRAR